MPARAGRRKGCRRCTLRRVTDRSRAGQGSEGSKSRGPSPNWAGILASIAIAALGVACPSAPAARPAAAPASASGSVAPSASSSAGPLASGSSAPRETVRFGRGGQPKVGERQRFESEERVRLNIPGRGPVKSAADSVVEGERVRATEEVLAVSGPVATKVRVKFDVWVSFSGGDEVARPQDGKTYVVERVGAEVRVGSESGGAVGADESGPIAKRYDRIGEPIELGLSLPDRAIVAGERVPELEAALPSRLMGADDPMRPRDVVVKFVALEQGGAVAVFEATMTLGGRGGGDGTMEAKVAGKIRLRVVDGRELEISGQGPLLVRNKGAPSMSGTVSLRATHEYL